MPLMYFAGTPATIVFSATSLVTTAPAPTMALPPIVTPGVTVTLEPIHTSFPILIGAGIRLPRFFLDFHYGSMLQEQHYAL